MLLRPALQIAHGFARACTRRPSAASAKNFVVGGTAELFKRERLAELQALKQVEFLPTSADNVALPRSHAERENASTARNRAPDFHIYLGSVIASDGVGQVWVISKDVVLGDALSNPGSSVGDAAQSSALGPLGVSRHG